jgi:hypothetical protein
MRISEMLIAVAEWLESPNNEAMLLAEYDDACLEKVAETCIKAAEILKSGAASVDAIEPAQESLITPSSIDALTEIAQALDESGDPDLIKSASVLDELLLTIAAPPDAVKNFKEAQERKIDVLKAKYQDVNKALHEQQKVGDTVKALEKSPYTKEYRIMEHALSTRGCPIHHGAQMARIGENTWQCDLDKAIFNYENGYTDDRGNKVPGGSVAAETPNSWPQPTSQFDTREQKLQMFDVYKS